MKLHAFCSLLRRVCFEHWTPQHLDTHQALSDAGAGTCNASPTSATSSPRTGGLPLWGGVSGTLVLHVQWEIWG